MGFIFGNMLTAGGYTVKNIPLALGHQTIGSSRENYDMSRMCANSLRCCLYTCQY